VRFPAATFRIRGTASDFNANYVNTKVMIKRSGDNYQYDWSVSVSSFVNPVQSHWGEASVVGSQVQDLPIGKSTYTWEIEVSTKDFEEGYQYSVYTMANDGPSASPGPNDEVGAAATVKFLFKLDSTDPGIVISSPTSDPAYDEPSANVYGNKWNNADIYHRGTAVDYGGANLWRVKYAIITSDGNLFWKRENRVIYNGYSCDGVSAAGWCYTPSLTNEIVYNEAVNVSGDWTVWQDTGVILERC